VWTRVIYVSVNVQLWVTHCIHSLLQYADVHTWGNTRLINSIFQSLLFLHCKLAIIDRTFIIFCVDRFYDLLF
jgi:hypothetical protein